MCVLGGLGGRIRPPPFFINKKGEKKGMHLLRWAHSSSPRPLLQNPSPSPFMDPPLEYHGYHHI